MTEFLMITAFLGLFVILSVVDKKYQLGLGLSGQSPTDGFSGKRFDHWGLDLSMESFVGTKDDSNLNCDQAMMTDHEIAELKQRVAVLEKIVTDEGYHLKREIDRL